MCDCFHLAFPNWHGSPGTGAGRSLKGPEPDTVDDSICEEPSEFIEGERPRPQGSSPVDEYPETDKYTDIDKQGGGGSGKKGKRGFGSLFEKRSPAKMSQLESSESGVIVRMAKETCAEGLVVSGGGKEGIFIKEVRPESPASKLLSVHEGDQILSATVYFDDVKYEDAIQILEHAQPYKMELLLKRKPIKISTLESEPALEFTQVEQGSSLEMRGHSKTKRHGDRISWPNFPSFSKSRKSHFKRSHSTADADDQRKLELSPTTSDTESPIKSQEAVKGRTKKQKIKLSSLKMKGHKSRSVEQSDQDTDIECVQVMEIQQSQDDIYSPDDLESTSGETPQVYVFESESEKMESTKIKNECTLPDLTGSETKQHKVELIRLDKTLKTTDITVAFADQESPLTKTSLEERKKKKEKKERSELKFRIKEKEKKDKHKQDIHVKSSPKSMKIPGADIISSDLSAHDNTLLIPTIVSHTKLEERQLPIDMSDVGLIRKSPQVGQERDLKETYVKTNLNAQEMNAKVTSITMEPDLQMEIQALKLPTEESIDDVLVQIGTRTATKFKLPREDLAHFVTDEPIKMTDVKIVEMDEKSLKVEDKGLKILPNRDDIEIPGMEDASSTGTKTPVIKQPKTAFTLPVEEIQAQSVQMVIDVDRVKEAVSKLPGFKLPKGDTVGLPAHQEITKTDVNAERVNMKVDTTVSKITDIKAQLDTYVKKTDINASPEKLSRSSVTTIKLPKNTLSDLGAHEPITMTEIYHKKRKEEAGRTNEFEIQIELHKREDVEIPGMENIHQKGSPSQLEREKELAVPVPEWSTIKAEETNVIPYTKGLDKKSKKAKMPMPGFGITQLDSLLGGQFSETQLSVNGEATSVDIKGGAIDIDDQAVDVDVKTQKLIEEQDRELKLPKFGISLPKVKGAESFSQKKVDVNGAERRKDIQASEVDVSLAKRNGEVLQPDVHIKAPEIQDEVKDTVGSPSRFKMPTLKFPKFGAAAPKVAVDVPDVEKDIKVQGTEIPEPKLTMSEINIEKPSVDIKGPSIDMDVNLKKLEMFTLPEVKVQVLPPSVELKVSSGEVEITEGAAKSRMSFPKIGFSKPEVKAQEVDITLSEVDISLPEGKVEFKEPEVEMKTPEIQVDVKDTVGSPSRFKMPTLKFPKFGAASPNVTIEVPDFEKDIKVHGTEIREPKLTISAINIEKPSVDLKGPSIDVNVNRKKNENVTLPEVKMNVQPPSIELKVPSGEVEMPEGAATEMDVKMKKPRMSFGWFSKPEMKAPKVDISLTNVDISLPEGKVEVKEPDVELKSPEVQIEMKHDIELEGQGSKFKLPKFGLSLPTVKGPEIGLSLSKTDVDVNLPEGRADLQLPDVEVGRPSVEVEIPEAGSKDIDVKMRKPRMSFPKFGFSKPDVKAPEVDISLPEVDISLPEGKVEVKEPELEMKTPEIQVDVKDTVGSPSRFKMPTLKFPKFGVTSPNVTIEVPDLDKDIKVHGTEIPEPKLTTSVINIEKPSVDLKGPSIDVNRKKNENVTLPEVKMNVQPPSIELKVPSGEVEMPEGAATEIDVKMKNPRMSFGWFSKPEMKAPEVDISLTNVDISLPEGKVEVKEPDVELKSPEVQIEMKHDIELEGQGSQFKLPKFGLSLPRVKGPEIGLSLSKTDVDVDLPEGRADLQLPDVEVGRPSVEVEIPEAGSKDIDVKMRKPRMSFPKFGFSKPEVTAPEVDISLPEVDISLPEGKVDVKEPELEMKTPEIQVDVKDTVGSPSRFKMPTLKFPKFGAASPNVTIEVPDLDKDIKVHGTEIPEPKLTISAINIEKPSVDLKGPSINVNRKKNENVTLPEIKMNVQPPSIELKVPSGEVEMPEGAATEMDVKMKKPRMSFGWFSKPEAKAPKVDISLTNVDISLPEGEVEIKEPDVEMKSPEVQIEMKHDIELEGQGSKFKLPKFGLSLPRVKGPEIGLSLSKTDVDINLPEGRADLQLPDVEVGRPSVEVEIPEAGSKDIDVKMRKPRMSFPKFGFSKPEVTAPEVDISLPEVDISLPEGKVEVKEPELEMKTPEIQVDVKDTVGSPSRFKMPTLKFPKFGAASPNVTIEVPDLDKDIKVHGTEIPEPKLTISAINIEKPSVDLKGPSINVNRKKNENVTLPEVKMNVQPPSIELKVPSGEVEMPEGAATEMDVKMKKPRMSFGWFSKPEAKAPKVDISLTNVDISLPEGEVEIKEPDVEMKSPEVQIEMKHDIELEGQGSKFKLPKFGLSLPRVKGPEIGLSLSKTDVDVNLPEGRADLQLPDVEVGRPSVEVEIPEAGSKDIDVKMRKPRMSFPKFGFSKPEVTAPEVDISLPEVDISLPEGKVEVKEPELEMKTPEIQVDVKDTVGSPSRFKMPTLKFPKFGAASPNVTIEVPDLDKDIKVHGTEIPEPKLTISAINIEKPSVDLKGPSINVNRKKNENVTLPEIKMNVQPPSIELKVPSGEVEMPEGAATEMDVKMKKPQMSFGWFSKPEAKAPKVDISLTNVDISLPEGEVEIKEPDVEMKSPEVQIEMKHDIELEGQGSKFKLPKFGLSLPRVKGPEIGLSLSKTDVDVNLPEGRADLQLPDVEVGRPSVEVEIPEAGSKDIDVKMRKPRMSFPKFGFSKPEVTAPEVDISLPEVDISLPEGKVEVKEPELEMKTPEIQVDVKDTVGSPSRFKMPTLKFPKFGAASPNVTIEVPDLDKDIKVHGTEIPEPKLTISAINIEKPSVDLKGPSINVNRKKNENVTLPEVKMNVQPPSIELKVPSGEVEMPEGAATEMDVKMKKPRMSFGWFSKPEAKAPKVDISLTNVDISLPEGEVEIKEPDVEMKSPEVQIEMKHDIELEGQGSKFKLPKFGLSLPRVKGPEIGLSLSKTDVDVDLPEGRADLQLPDVEVGRPSVEVEIPEAGSKDIDVKMRKPRMSFPKFGFSKPEVTAPEVDISLPEVDISLPEGKVEVKEPELEMKTPEIQVDVKDTVGSPSRFKMPTLKFPKFGAASPNVTIEVPDLDKDIKVHGTEIPEPKLTISAINIEKPSVDLKGPSINVNRKKNENVTLPEVKMNVQPPSIELKVPSGEVEMPEGAATEMDVKMKKPRMSFGWFSKPEAKAPKVDISLTNVDISLPEGEVEIKEPDVEMKSPEVQIEMKHDIELEGQGSKFKLPKFGLSLPRVKGPEIGLSLSKTHVDVDLPEGRADLQLPDVEVGRPSVEVEIPEAGSKDIDVKMRKPRMSFPKFGFSKPEVTAPEVDISLPEVDISLPEGKVEVKEPELEMKTPEIQVDVKDTVGSPSRFKMPTLKFPKFGAASPNVTIEVPDLDKDIKVHGTEIPEPKLTISAINIEKPSVDLKGPSINVNRKKNENVTLPEVKMNVQPPSIELKVPSGEVEMPEGAATEMDVKMKKPRMSFGWFSKPEAKAPKVDISLTNVDISLPEGEVEIKEPDVEMKSPEVQIEMKHDIELEGQGSKFKLPKFGLSLPRVKGPEIGLSLSKTHVDVDLPEGRADLQLPDVEVGRPSVEVEIPEAGSKDIDVKMRKPRMSFPKFGFSKPEVTASEVDISLPEVDISLPEGKVEVKEPELEMKTPEIQVDVKDTVGSPSRFKMPTLKFPKFGAASPNVTIEVPDLDKDIKVHGTEIPEPKLTISAINVEKPSVDLKGQSIDVDVSRKITENVTLPEVKMKDQPASIELKAPSVEVEIPKGAATEMDVKMKKPRMSFGWFSKPDAKALEVDVSLTKEDFSLPVGKVVKESYVEMIAPESQVEMKNEGFSVDGKLQTPDIEDKMIEMGVKRPLIITSPEIVVIPPNVDVSLPEGKEFKVPEVKVKAPEIEVDVKDAVGSPSRFKMPTFKLPTFGATSKVSVDVSDKEKDIDVPGVEIPDQVLGASFPVDLTEPGDTVDIKGCSEVQLHVAGSEGPSVEEGMTVADVDVHDVDSSGLTIDDKGHGLPSKGQGSPSKFKLPTFKMPKLSISKSKPQNEHEHDDISPNIILENSEIHVEPEGPEISPKLTLTAFGEVLRSIDVEFYVPALEEVEEKLTGSREEITASRKTKLNAQPSAETQSVQEEEEAKEKSKFVWFKFPTFGLSSPSESAKILEKETSEKEASEKSPAGDSEEQDSSLTFSVRSSDAFADISSTVTSEQVAPSLASPTKVTVKYSDPIANEIQGNVITSTARTKIISFEPYLAEKVTIPMSSGTSSSSVDTLKLESGTHVITSNIQAIPDTQKATLLTDFGLQTGTAGASSASWSVDDTNKTQSDGQTVIKRHVVREMSGTDKETVVITRRVTHVIGAEPISDETASSIKQMKETMHSEKMKFFDGAELE